MAGFSGRLLRRIRFGLAFSLAIAPAAQAHFQELIPSTDQVTARGAEGLTLDLTFTHPLTRGPVMAMGEPVRFGVLGPRGLVDLRAGLEPVTRDGKRAYRARYPIQRPGDYVFFVEPAPYWDPGEARMIVQYTKVVVDAFGAGEGWDRLVGLPLEIEPLVRPYGLWTGNLFRGIVRRDGEPVPFALVEVEWRNDGSIDRPAARPTPDDPPRSTVALETQVIKADGNGVFSYAMPRPGWWGFAAVLEAPAKVPGPDGGPVPVEEGALIWVRVRDMAP